MQKKINKMIKLLIVFCLLFSQVSPTVKVFADAVTPVYDLILGLNDSYSLLIDNNGSKEFSADQKYIIKTVTSFMYVDGSKALDEIEYYSITNGNNIESGINTALSQMQVGYNGTFNANVMIYNTAGIDYTGDNSNLSYEEFISTNSLVLEIEKDISKIIDNNLSGLNYTSTTTGTGYDCQEDICTLSKDATDKIITNTITIDNGDLNPNKTYYLSKKTNGIVDTEISNVNTFNFSNLLYGTYVFTYYYGTLGNDVLTKTFTVIYGDKSENDLTTYFDFTSSLTDAQKMNIVYSYSSLTKEEKSSLPTGYDLVAYDYFDKQLDNSLNNSPKIKFNYYTSVTNEGNEYSPYVLISENGRLNESDIITTVSELSSVINNAIRGDNFISYSILNRNNTLASSTSYLETGMVVRINHHGIIKNYIIYVVGDFDGGLVTDSDVLELINNAIVREDNKYLKEYISDINNDKNVDLLDVTSMIRAINDGTWNCSDEVNFSDQLAMHLTNNDLLRVGDEFEVKYSVDGFANDKINGLSGTLNYDKNALELVSASIVDSVTNEWYGNINIDDGKFIYATNSEFDKENVEIIFKFRALSESKSTVLVENARLAFNGIEYLNLESNKVKLELNVFRAIHTNNNLSSLSSSVGNIDFNKDILEYTIYVNSNINKVSLTGTLEDEYATVTGLCEYKLTTNVTSALITVTAEDGNTKTYKVSFVKVYPKSNNNNLQSLLIKGYEIDFNPSILEYSITVMGNVNSLDLTALVEDINSNIVIKGNENFKEGENNVIITVTAEDGSTKDYSIKVTKEKENKVTSKASNDDKIDGQKTSSTEKIIIIILIILVIVGLIYLIFFKEEDEVISNNKQNK